LALGGVEQGPDVAAFDCIGGNEEVLDANAGSQRVRREVCAVEQNESPIVAARDGATPGHRGILPAADSLHEPTEE
jgi:hypothetical protein